MSAPTHFSFLLVLVSLPLLPLPSPPPDYTMSVRKKTHTTKRVILSTKMRKEKKRKQPLLLLERWKKMVKGKTLTHWFVSEPVTL
jgi:hypothetical protein